MKKLIGAAMMVGAAVATTGVAHAEGSFSGSVNFTSDYVFRGISQTDGGAAIQGSMDYTDDSSSIPWYAGVWGSNVNFGATSPTETASMELDAYVGIRPKTGPISWDLGVLGYFYPNADDELAGGNELDYYEAAVGASMDVMTNLTLGVNFNYSNDYFAETGTAWYAELNGTYKVSDALSFSAAYGHQDVDDLGDYNSWNIGGTYAMHGFALGLTYTDTDDGAVDNGFSNESNSDGRLVFSVGRSL